MVFHRAAATGYAADNKPAEPAANLFGSTSEEFLHMDFLSSPHRKGLAGSIEPELAAGAGPNATGAIRHEPRSKHSSQQATAFAIQRGFSIDEGDRYFTPQCLQQVRDQLQQQQQELDQSGRHGSRRLLCWPNKEQPSYVKQARRCLAGGRPLKFSRMMTFKRVQVCLLLLALLIVGLVVATLLLGGQLGTELDDSERAATSSSSLASSRAVPATNSSLQSSPLEAQQLQQHHEDIKLELRTLELVDLLEADKTFAFIRYKILVRVPKSTPAYRQQPAFLHQSASGISSSSSSSSSSSISTSASSPVEHRHSKTGNKFVYTSKQQSQDQQPAEGANKRPTFSDRQARVRPEPSAQSVLEARIRPVASDAVAVPPQAGAVAQDANTLRELAALVALSTGRRQDQTEDQDHAEISALDRIDPIEAAASRLHIEPPEPHKRQLVDCFLADIEKRYQQKVAIEDKFRHVASTRRVQLKEMLDVIVECRQLTWASLPRELAGIRPVDLVRSAEPETQATPATGGPLEANNKPADLFESILSNWFQAPNVSSSDQQTARQASGASDGPPGAVASLLVAGSNRVASLTSSPIKPVDTSKSALAQQQQASYLNMGLSMMNGIVPNTLWCGLGDRAANYSELGADYKVDSCCRSHDHCPVRLKPFSTDYGLVNWSMSTKSHCSCDVDFNTCLETVNTTLSNVIKALYFRFIGIQCIDTEPHSEVS